MSLTVPTPTDLPAWLSYIEGLHPKAIEMGLGRVNQMIERLALKPNFRIVTVAGTNGKGSTCAMLSEIYQQAGYRVGSYTSPHLLRYNERVRINGLDATDVELCNAFQTIDAARNQPSLIELTYFEVGTLAAIWHFMHSDIDVAILEIGLGGRLDAVNAFEPDCAIVTSIDLDHQEFLGHTREAIGFEKAGVYRQAKPAIVGETQPPHTLIDYAHSIQADLKVLEHAFGYQVTDLGWQFLLNQRPLYTLPLPALKGDYQLSNAACAVAAIESLQPLLPVTQSAIAEALLKVKLSGRFQVIHHQPDVILDVAHNPHAAIALAKNLTQVRLEKGRTLAVFAMLADKDIAGVINATIEEIDIWYVGSISHVRGAKAADLVQAILNIKPQAIIYQFERVEEAFKQACIEVQRYKDVHENDKIVVFGSFFTVSAVMQALESRTIEITHF